MSYLLLTVRFLDGRYHGQLNDGGPPEWPPSPFRLFQALVAGLARRGELVDGDDVPENTNFTGIGKALGWLQKHSREFPPVIVAPRSKIGQAIMRYGPDNDGDDADFQKEPEKFRSGKHTQPTIFLLDPDQKPEVHYAWHLPEDHNCPWADIERAARSLTSLGWGIDMAFADARPASEVEVQKLKGIRWHPKKRDWPFRDTLRTPTYDDDSGECTLCDLRHCHSTFVSRIEHGKPLKTVDKPKIFDRVLYTSIERQIGRPHVVFKLVDENENTFRYPHAKLIHIAGMVRHLAINAMQAEIGGRDWITADWVNHVVRGRKDDNSKEEHQQFAYIPLPSIGHEHADAMIRNVLIVAPWGMDRELEHLASHLNGMELEPEANHESCESKMRPAIERQIMLHQFNPPDGRFIKKCYLGESCHWQTVTPVILDGHDDRKPSKTAKLIETALRRALVETPCEFTWQALPFHKNCLSAHKYDRNGRRAGYYRPKHLEDRTMVHVRLRFRNAVKGPLALGAGRYCGLGLFAAEE